MKTKIQEYHNVSGNIMKSTGKLISAVIIFAAMLFTKNINAQAVLTTTPEYKNSYNTAIGVRGGGTSGLTFKRLTGRNAIEGIIGMWGYGLSLTGLYERYTPAGVDGLNWYYGGGGHVAFSTGRTFYRNFRDYDNYYAGEGGVGIGLDGILGIEYKIPPIPFAISFDIKPFFEVNTRGGAYIALDPGIGIKIAF